MGCQQAFDQLQKMSSDAVYLILEGRPEEALKSLANCADAIRFYLASVKDATPTSRRQALPTSDILSLYAVSLDEVIYPFDCSERVSPDNCFRLHRFVYLVDGETSHPTIGVFHNLLATVLYNMAAVSHESVHGGIYPKVLEKTRTFYELALAVLESEQDDAATFDMLPLLLALYNNLGHINAFFFQRVETIYCRNRLDALVADLQTNGYHPEAYACFLPAALARNHISKAPAA